MECIGVENNELGWSGEAHNRNEWSEVNVRDGVTQNI